MADKVSFGGQFSVSLDEKGRMIIPVQLRAELEERALIITKGIEECLMLFPQAVWQHFSNHIVNNRTPLERNMRYVQRRIIAPARECKLDGNGRIHIASTLARDVGISRECTLLGMGEYLEIWGEAQYRKYNEKYNEDIMAAAEVVVRNWEDSS